MQVFMPFRDLKQSVSCLDPSRLGNQIWREAKTLLNGGWVNHPAAKMWANYKPALAVYCLHGIEELVNRNAINLGKASDLRTEFLTYTSEEVSTNGVSFIKCPWPPFMGNEEYHLSHRLNLLYKNPIWYSKYFTETPPQEKPEYVWPVP